MRRSTAPHSGFTLVEIIVGITVLTIVLVAIAVLTLTAIRANAANIHRLTAYYLAQEGLEGFRNMRDSNWLQNYGWNRGRDFWGAEFSNFDSAQTFQPVQYYVMEYLPNAALNEEAPWSLGGSYASEDIALAKGLLVWSASHYGLEGGEGAVATPYTRIFRVEYESDDRLEVTAMVSWMEHTRLDSIEVSTELTDWREGPI